MLPLQKRNYVSAAGGIFGRRWQFVLFHTLVSVLLLFNQHALAQLGPCSEEEVAVYDVSGQNFQACLRESGDNFFCTQTLVASMSGVSQACVFFMDCLRLDRNCGGGMSDFRLRVFSVRSRTAALPPARHRGGA